MAPRRSGSGRQGGPGGLQHPGMAPVRGGPHPSNQSKTTQNILEQDFREFANIFVKESVTEICEDVKA